MYKTKPLFAYAEGMYSIMPPGLPDNFYPRDVNRIYKTEKYVICFNEGVLSDIKSRLIKDYTEYYNKEKSLGIFR